MTWKKLEKINFLKVIKSACVSHCSEYLAFEGRGILMVSHAKRFFSASNDDDVRSTVSYHVYKSTNLILWITLATETTVFEQQISLNVWITTALCYSTINCTYWEKIHRSFNCWLINSVNIVHDQCQLYVIFIAAKPGNEIECGAVSNTTWSAWCHCLIRLDGRFCVCRFLLHKNIGQNMVNRLKLFELRRQRTVLAAYIWQQHEKQDQNKISNKYLCAFLSVRMIFSGQIRNLII